MPEQKGLAPIIYVILIAVIIAALVYFVFIQKKSQQPAFNVKTEYQNPFRSSTQNEEYVNPFENLK